MKYASLCFEMRNASIMYIRGFGARHSCRIGHSRNNLRADAANAWPFSHAVKGKHICFLAKISSPDG